jgi:hypothetical protein
MSKVFRLPTPVQKTWHTFIRPGLPEWSFITIHYLYFLIVCFVTSLMFWGTSTPSKSVSYTDSLFLVVSAMTEAGLNTVNLSQLNTFQQVLLFALIVIGSAIWVSIATIHIRKRAFEQKLQELADKRKKRLGLSRTLQISLSKPWRNSDGDREAAIASGAVRGRAISNSDPTWKDNASPLPHDRTNYRPPDVRVNGKEHEALRKSEEPLRSTAQPESSPASPSNHVITELHLATGSGDGLDDSGSPGSSASEPPGKVKFAVSPHPNPVNHDLYSPAPLQRYPTRIFSGNGVGARPRLNNHPRNAIPRVDQSRLIADEEKALKRDDNSHAILKKYLDGINGLVGRNSQFHGLTEKERRKLGGLEYDALALLAYLVPAYFLLFQLFGLIGIGAWIQLNMPEVPLQNGINPFWTGAFFAIVSVPFLCSITLSNDFQECLQQFWHGKFRAPVHT